jgi:hypothetical protein
MNPIELIEDHMRHVNVQMFPTHKRFFQLTLHAFSLICRITTYELYLNEASLGEGLVVKTWWDYFEDMMKWAQQGVPHPWNIVTINLHWVKAQTSQAHLTEIISPLMNVELSVLPIPREEWEGREKSETTAGGVYELTFGFDVPQVRYRWLEIPQNWQPLLSIVEDLQAEMDELLYKR